MSLGTEPSTLEGVGVPLDGIRGLELAPAFRVTVYRSHPKPYP